MSKKPEKLIKLINAKAFCFALVLIAVTSFGQSITWQKILNNSGRINKIEETNDGKYILVGNIRIDNQTKIYLAKLNQQGLLLWEKFYGIGNSDGKWIQETSDNGFIIGGSTDSGNTTSMAYIIKTNPEGNLLWSKTFRNSTLDQCYCIKEIPSGGYILSCRTIPLQLNIVMFLRIDINGNLIWLKEYSKGINPLFINELLIFGQGFIAAGNLGIQNNSNAFLAKFNLNCDTIWTKQYGGNKVDGLNSMDIVNNEGFILGGISNSFNPNLNIETYVIKVDTSGNIIWQNTYSSYSIDFCNSIRFIPNVGFSLAGYSDTLNFPDIKAKIRIIDTNGTELFTKSYLSENYISSSFNTIESTTDKGYITAGQINTANNFANMYIVKTDSLLETKIIGIIKNNEINLKEYFLYQNYPNPFNPTTNIKFEIPKEAHVSIKIYDLLGREVFSVSEYKQAGSYEVMFDGSNLASGLYFYSIKAETSQRDVYTETKKMVLIK